jgi:hypothetical protein
MPPRDPDPGGGDPERSGASAVAKGESEDRRISANATAPRHVGMNRFQRTVVIERSTSKDHRRKVRIDIARDRADHGNDPTDWAGCNLPPAAAGSLISLR